MSSLGWPFNFEQGVGGGQGGLNGVETGWSDFERLLGTGLDLGCILTVGWP